MPPSPPLPEERVKNIQSFSVTVVDCSGAITIQEGDELVNIYACLVTCTVTLYSVGHLELVGDLSAQTFVTVFRRLRARKSCPKVMISANASTFRTG